MILRIRCIARQIHHASSIGISCTLVSFHATKILEIKSYWMQAHAFLLHSQKEIERGEYHSSIKHYEMLSRDLLGIPSLGLYSYMFCYEKYRRNDIGFDLRSTINLEVNGICIYRMFSNQIFLWLWNALQRNVISPEIVDINFSSFASTSTMFILKQQCTLWESFNKMLTFKV